MTSASAWPSIIGPQKPTQSTYVRPSTSVNVAPEADSIKRGVPPTPRNARTGEFTPPGINSTARANNSSELSRVSLSVALMQAMIRQKLQYRERGATGIKHRDTEAQR